MIYLVPRDLDASTVHSIKPEVERLAESDADVVLDMHNVTFIDSSGVGMIVFLFKRLRERRLSLRLANVGGQPERLMKQLRLTFLVANEAALSAAK